MRPLELKLRNFKSYFGDEAVFDFRDRRLIGIVGPIGSGKSSILDAIAFALYGKTPTVAANTRGHSTAWPIQGAGRNQKGSHSRRLIKRPLISEFIPST